MVRMRPDKAAYFEKSLKYKTAAEASGKDVSQQESLSYQLVPVKESDWAVLNVTAKMLVQSSLRVVVFY